MSLEIKIPKYKAYIECYVNTTGNLGIAVLDFDKDCSAITLTPRMAERLAAILMAWAEKGYLPEKEEVWE